MGLNYKNKNYNAWLRLKRFGITGFLRVILSAVGGFFLSLIIMSAILNLVYDKDGFILLTNTFLWEEIGFAVIWIEIFVILFAVLSVAEQGIRKIFHDKKAENFALNSFDILMDADAEKHYEEISSEKYAELNPSYKSEYFEKDVVYGVNKEEKSFEWLKGVAVLLIVFVVFNAADLYLYTTGRTAVYKTRIIKTSFVNPLGNTYTYDDISEYFVEINDNYPQLRLVTNSGKNLKFSTAEISVSADETKSSESALVEIDKLLKEHKIKKTLNCSQSDFSQIYTDIDEIKPLFE